MKKGCFIKSIIILTIFVAVIAYFVRYRFNDLILIPERYIVNKGLSDRLKDLKESPEKDSLKVLFQEYAHNVKRFDSASRKSLEAVSDSLKEILNDTIITHEDINRIKKIMELQSKK